MSLSPPAPISTNPFEHFIHDPSSNGDQHNVAARTVPFVPWVIRQPAQRPVIQAFAVIAVRQWPATHQMNTRRWRSTAYEIATVIVNSLAHRAEVPWRRTAAMIVLRATVIVAVIVTAVIVVALLRAAAVVIVALISTRTQQRGGAEHQHTEAGNQTFRHFHRVFPHRTYSKKGFRT